MKETNSGTTCPLCRGTYLTGNRVTGYKPCSHCLDTEEFTQMKNELGTAYCVHCMGTGKGGDYITGFIPCTHCRGMGKT